MALSGIEGISNWRQPHAPAGLPALGRLQTVKALPRSVAGMADDLRRSGAIAKDLTRYAEFLWADHLRVRLKASLIAQDHRQGHGARACAGAGTSGRLSAGLVRY